MQGWSFQGLREIFGSLATTSWMWGNSGGSIIGGERSSDGTSLTRASGLGVTLFIPCIPTAIDFFLVGVVSLGFK
jgi:hypothetical protein